MGMGIGGYKIVIHDDGGHSRELTAIESVQIPLPGWNVEIDGALYVVTDVRTVQDFDETSEPDKLHTYPRVALKRIGNAPPPPRTPTDANDGPTTNEPARVLQFRSIALSDATEFDAQAAAKARATHDATTVHVRRVGRTERPTIQIVPARLQQEDRTVFDELADDRARTAHDEQRAIEQQRGFPRPIASEESAPIMPVTDAPTRTILPWRRG